MLITKQVLILFFSPFKMTPSVTRIVSGKNLTEGEALTEIIFRSLIVTKLI